MSQEKILCKNYKCTNKCFNVSCEACKNIKTLHIKYIILAAIESKY